MLIHSVIKPQARISSMWEPRQHGGVGPVISGAGLPKFRAQLHFSLAMHALERSRLLYATVSSSPTWSPLMELP